jgi:hypothetical protein
MTHQVSTESILKLIKLPSAAIDPQDHIEPGYLASRHLAVNGDRARSVSTRGGF